MAVTRDIPVLDCADITNLLEPNQDSPGFKKFAQLLGKEMRETGFVYLVNHGISVKTVEHFNAKCREFFALPKKVKLQYKKADPIRSYHGYTAAAEENLGNLEHLVKGVAPEELKECFDFVSTGPTAIYPTEIEGFKKAFEAFRTSLVGLSTKLLRAFAQCLDVNEATLPSLRKGVQNPSMASHNSIRCNFYFPIESTGGVLLETIRLGEHCDWATFTMLFQDDVGGLEAKMSTGEWVPVKPIKGSIVLNAGLLLEKWSGGNFTANFHRVKAVKHEQISKYRQSVAFFVQPDPDARCSPLVPLKDGWEAGPTVIGDETYAEYYAKQVELIRGEY